MAQMIKPVLLSHQEEWATDSGVDDENGLVSWLEAFPRVLAIDPGGTTGWCVLWFDPEALVDTKRPVHSATVAWQAGVVTGDENGQVDKMIGMVKRYGMSKYEETGELGVVIESFQLRSKITSPELLSPVRLTAVLGYVLSRGVKCRDGVVRRYQYATNTSSDAMNVVPDKRLRDYDMYLPGPDHPRDATRHALLWLRRLRSDYNLLLKFHDLKALDFERD